ncbi:MAG: ROK family protein [Actinomycetota bacterium]|nr:ROK family protein [Actinomycetota bacterium]
MDHEPEIVHPEGDGLDIDEAPGPRRKALIGVDIGGSKFAVGVITSRGQLIDRSMAKVDPDVSGESHYEMLVELVDEQLELAEDRHDVELVAAGIGSAGPIAPNCEVVSPLNIPSWRDFPLRSRLQELTGLPTFGDLDAKALALAEGWLGAAQGVSNYCAMTVSTGVGGGLVLDGHLIDGASANAGHVGHVIVEPQGRRCACGARGCLEAEASGLAIEAITGRSPTEPSYEIMERTGRMVGRAAASMCNLFDLDLVVVGGSVALGFGATFFNAANLELHARAKVAHSRQARVVPTRLEDRGPLIGAAAVGIRGLRRRPIPGAASIDPTPARGRPTAAAAPLPNPYKAGPYDDAK